MGECYWGGIGGAKVQSGNYTGNTIALSSVPALLVINYSWYDSYSATTFFGSASIVIAQGTSVAVETYGSSGRRQVTASVSGTTISLSGISGSSGTYVAIG